MSGYAIGNFFVYAVINAITPGPGNTLALNTVGSYGWKKGKPLFFGIFAGYYVVQILCAVFVLGVNTFLPDVSRVMEYIGAVYILRFAIHTAVSKPIDDSGEKSASPIKDSLLQFVNVKIYLLGTTALTGCITDYSTSFSALSVIEFTIVIIGIVATLIQIGLGILLRTIYQKYCRPTDIVLALTLFERIYSMPK